MKMDIKYWILDIENGTMRPDPEMEIEPSYELINRLELLILAELAKIDNEAFSDGKPGQPMTWKKCATLMIWMKGWKFGEKQ